MEELRYDSQFPLAICKGIYKIPSNPDALCVVWMGFAGSLDSLKKCWGGRVAKKKARLSDSGGKKNSEQLCQWKSPNKSEERGSGKKGDRVSRAC